MVGPFVLPHLCRNIKIFSPLLYALQLLHLRSFSFQKKIHKLRNAKVIFFWHNSFFDFEIFIWIDYNSGAGTRGGQRGHLPPQYLLDQLTLLKLGEGRLSPPVTTGPPPMFLTFRHHWNYKIAMTEINTQLLFWRNMNFICLNFKTNVSQ